MIGPKLDVRCQMPDVDAVCSAGHSLLSAPANVVIVRITEDVRELREVRVERGDTTRQKRIVDKSDK